MTMLVKVAALIKDLIVANRFGVSAELDAFLIAFALPQFVISVVAGGFHTSLVPTYIEVRAHVGVAAAQDLLSAITSRALLILGICTAGLVAAGPLVLPLIGSSFNDHTSAQLQTMYWIVLPTIVISGIGVIWAAVLNAQDRFVLAALSPASVPIMTILLVLLAGDQLGAYGLPLGLISGLCIQSAILAYSLDRRGISLKLNWHSEQAEHVRQVLAQFLPLALAAMMSAGNELIDQSMAAQLGAGSVAALNYGVKLVSLAIAVASTGLGATILVHFSKLVAVGSWAVLRRTYFRYIIAIISTSVPFVIVGMIVSEPMVRLMYERGAFSPEDTELVSHVQVAYLLQVPFYLLIIMSMRLLSALKMQSVFVVGTVLNFALNIGLNLLFMPLWGVAGVALSTSCVTIVSFVYLFSQASCGLARQMRSA